ncbi:MAG: glycosyltransferase family 39 protein, partial [Acidobacteriota bacterium]|nr:glycosyltransferase family 39 protein [Acidobacteriota bacterium]
GFFWFYFFNEHILRFLNKRYPRDYNTVPRALFWAFHLIWLFPWSVYLPAVVRLPFRGPERAARVRLLGLCWLGFVLLFFTFSTTQEYYSMPCYPAFALLLGSAMASDSKLLRPATKAVAAFSAALCAVFLFLLAQTRGLPTPGDISVALNANPDLYTLSLGHMADLTGQAFAYLRLPLALAAFAMAVGAAGAWFFQGRRAYLSLAVMMILFFQAARIALVAFNPYLGSKPLADALMTAPPGELIVDDQYYTFSSVFFYANRDAWLLNGRINNLEYGSYAPDAKNVFLDDQQFRKRWQSGQRYYLVAEDKPAQRLHALVPGGPWRTVAESGGKVLLTNQ